MRRRLPAGVALGVLGFLLATVPVGATPGNGPLAEYKIMFDIRYPAVANADGSETFQLCTLDWRPVGFVVVKNLFGPRECVTDREGNLIPQPFSERWIYSLNCGGTLYVPASHGTATSCFEGGHGIFQSHLDGRVTAATGVFTGFATGRFSTVIQMDALVPSEEAIVETLPDGEDQLGFTCRCTLTFFGPGPDGPPSTCFDGGD